MTSPNDLSFDLLEVPSFLAFSSLIFFSNFSHSER